MAKVLRFMSANEAIRLLDGETLKNTTDHGDENHHQRTNSVGFCFAIVGHNEASDAAMYRAAKFLAGVVEMDVCLIGELRSTRNFTKSWGHYSTGVEQERCAAKYGLSDFEGWDMWTPDLTKLEKLFGALKLPPGSDCWGSPVWATSKGMQ